jgi:hypothetical protein
VNLFRQYGRSVAGALLIAASFAIALVAGLVVLMIRVDREVTAVETVIAAGLPLMCFALGVGLWTSGWLRLARHRRESAGA